MYKYIDGRGTGKTSKLIETAASDLNPVCIVCQNPSLMREKIHNLGYGIADDIMTISYAEYVYGKDDLEVGRNIYIDEVDMLLKHFDQMIKGYTLSIED